MAELKKTKDVLLKTKNGLLKTEDGLLKTEDVLLKTKDGLLKTEDGLLRTEDVLLKTKNGPSVNRKLLTHILTNVILIIQGIWNAKVGQDALVDWKEVMGP